MPESSVSTTPAAAPEAALAPPPPGRENLLSAAVRALRPKQWTKNAAVLAPLVFAHKALVPGLVLKAFAATVGFCLLSSAVYVFNDLVDREKDRLHPVKRLRPIASGALGTFPAVGLGLVVGLAGLALIGTLASSYAFYGALGYLALQALYTLAIKRVAILDIIAIAIGFVIRVASGALAIDVPISSWLYICAFLLALFLGFAKRRAEIVLLDKAAGEHRANLADLSLPLLDQLIAVVTASTVVCYALYTMSEETVRKFHTDNLKFTIPCVIYAIFRYLYLIYRKGEGGSPERLLLSDVPLIATILVFCGIVGVVLYL